MAKVVPEGWREMTAVGAAQRELETLAVLADGLPEDYTVYHGVHWTRIQHGFALVGEIDFAIVSPAGKLLLIEQKSGFLNETPEGLVKVYAAKEKLVASQMVRSADALHQRLRLFCPEGQFSVDSLLFCPDYTVKQPGSAGIAPERMQRLLRISGGGDVGNSFEQMNTPVIAVSGKANLEYADAFGNRAVIRSGEIESANLRIIDVSALQFAQI